MKIPVLILNYKRAHNIQHYIIPSLLQNTLVSKIIIAHGLKDTVFGIDSLEDGEIKQVDNILHIGNFSENANYRCFRRWNLIQTLKKSGMLTEECILVQDDDYFFREGEIEKIVCAYKEKKGTLISGHVGRRIVNNTYTYFQKIESCDVVIGRSIFGNIQKICDAVEDIHRLNIHPNILFEDDIIISFFTSNKKFNNTHYSLRLSIQELPSNDAVCMQTGHLARRNRTVQYLSKRFHNIIHSLKPFTLFKHHSWNNMHRL